ncbi:MAG: hypothetical protein NXI13_13860 [Proteobacteria bacterium]|nr:hypothetical protein [Pseudomonadota bacterium]
MSLLQWIERDYSAVGLVDVRELGRFIALNFPFTIEETERRKALKETTNG